METPVDDLVDVELEDTDAISFSKSANRRTTDLVRLYLQEIGRVRLLRRDEEVSEAQKVQRYMRLLDLRIEFAKKGDEVIARFVHLIDAHDRLVSQLGHRPSLERWAASAGVEVADLKPSLAAGKQRWAELAGLSVKELEQIQSQGNRAKEHMIKANLRLVVSVAKKYQNRGLELLDLIQEGTLGLERAVEKFDPTKGYRFSTYAYWWIRQGITRTIANQGRTIRLPVHIVEQLNKLKRVYRELRRSLQRNPSEAELAREMEVTCQQLRYLQQIRRQSLSLNHRIGSEESSELLDVLEDNATQSPEAQMNEMMMRQDILEVLDSILTEREKEIVAMRYGLLTGEPYTLEEVSSLFNLSRERVRQIQNKAMRKLRRPQVTERLKGWLK